MKPFVLTNAAKADLKAIAIFTEKRWGREQRNNYIKQFDNTFHLLAKNPSIGKACDHIKTGYQKFPHSSHIIFYQRGSKSVIEIIRILHKNMDTKPELEGS